MQPINLTPIISFRPTERERGSEERRKDTTGKIKINFKFLESLTFFPRYRKYLHLKMHSGSTNSYNDSKRNVERWRERKRISD